MTVDVRIGEVDSSPTGWDSIDTLAAKAVNQSAENANLEHASLYRQLFATELGQIILKDLIDMYLWQRIARPGDDLLNVGIRQGGADVVRRILTMIDFANSGGRESAAQGVTVKVKANDEEENQ